MGWLIGGMIEQPPGGDEHPATECEDWPGEQQCWIFYYQSTYLQLTYY